MTARHARSPTPPVATITYTVGTGAGGPVSDGAPW